MKINELAYPVMIISEDCYTYVFVDEDILTTLNSTTLKQGGWNGCLLIDSDGKAAKIKNTKFVAGKGLFWGYTVFLDRICRIELVLDEPFDISLDEFKQKVIRYIRMSSGGVEAGYAKQEIHRVYKAQSVKEIIEIVLPQCDFRTLL